MLSRGTSSSGNDASKQLHQANLKGNELAYRLAIQTAKALQNYARTGDIKYLLYTMRHLTAIPDENGDNAIHISVVHSQKEALLEMVQVVDKSPELDPLNMFNELIQTPLHIAVHINIPEIVEALIKHGANVNLLDRHGNSAVHIAAQHGKPEILQVLLNRSNYKGNFEEEVANLNVMNYDGFTPMHLAVISNSLSCVKVLCEARCKLNIPDGTSGRTALHLAIENNNKPILAYLLKQKSIDVDCQAFNGCTPLHFAISMDLHDVVKMLIAAEADPYIESCECVQEETTSDEETKTPEGASTQTEDDDDSMRRCNSFDLARDNQKILVMLDPMMQDQTLKCYMQERSSGSSVPPHETEQRPSKYDDSGMYLDTEEIHTEYSFGQAKKQVSNLESKSLPAIDSGIIEDIDMKKPLDSGIVTSAFDSLDPVTRKKLAILLDSKGKQNWQELAEILELDHLSFAFQSADSPTLSLLTYIESLGELECGLKNMGFKKALDLLEDYQTQGCKTSTRESGKGLTEQMGDLKLDQ